MGLLDLAVVEAEMKAEQAKSEAKEKARVDREARRKPSEEGYGVFGKCSEGQVLRLGRERTAYA